ncbi:B12-binding domain/radical SAM domain protein, MJ_1487 family [Desulfacinum hydrothermale DSM 13146]|uniref:B12-binding domain/radical SAM domain protein, MJ_1487 family n=1 Tax=Desulfacinum hydrothermale DSM 13146 TaxID=1121390 RepID=A0A1W1XC19_9BACT|nr:TIGR04013 family B12-binding domain/radical SAM domain-containing protein [Desulfacinum hydrothermale]SMC21595.1 B12-binding domain/radical SAM domain protein, MJ_1487 family [Desulfacinum hydrothermale DSM 13146]
MAASQALVFRLTKSNRYSFLALLASLEALAEPLDHTPVYWLDSRAKEMVMSQVERLLRSYERLLLCYSFMTPQWPSVREELHLLAAAPWRDRIFLAAGGPHPAGDPKRTLQSGFDAVCLGDGEAVFGALVRAWLRKESLQTVAGLYLAGPQGPVHTGRAPRVDLDRVPALPIGHGKFGPIEITRGCPYGCKYCQTPRLKGRRVRHRSLERIFQAVEAMVAAERTDIRFISPNALAYGSSDGLVWNGEAVEALLSGIRKRLPPHGRIFFGTFPSEVRPEFVHGRALETIARYCDNRQLVMGAQSGDARMLERMGRGHGLREVRQACRAMASQGFQPIVDFILGLPGESEQGMHRSVDFMEELVDAGARIHAHAFVPLPGSPWAGASPERIPEGVRQRLERLISHGKLFGQWKAQEEMGKGASRASVQCN